MPTSGVRQRAVTAMAVWLAASATCADAAPLSTAVRFPAAPTLRSVALAGGRVVLGVQGSSSPANPFPGAALIFDATGGALLRTIPNPTGDAADDFGYAVAIKGDLVAVSAPQYQTTPTGTAGAVHLFDAVTGALLRTLVSPDAPTTYDGFGRALAWLGDDLLVGEPQVYPPIFFTGGPGHVRLFDPESGTLVRTLDPPPATCCGFGSAIAASAAGVLVGMPLYEAAGVDVGAGYLLDAGSGAVLQTFANPDPDADEFFPNSIAAVGSKVLVGVPFESSVATWNGLVYVFDAVTGALEQTLLPPPGLSGAELGSAVAEIGGHAAAGTFYFDHLLVFDVTTGAILQHLTPPDPTTSANLGFGSMLASDGGRLLAGAATILPSKTTQGGAYLLDLCGNGTTSPLEHCDDGNTASGDGCSAGCLFEACGAVPSGACRPPDAGGAALKVKQSSDDERDQLTWKWRSAAGTVLGDFGDPPTTTGYQLCLYDGGAEAQPRLDLAAPAGGACATRSCWHPVSAGFQFTDKSRTPSGIEKLGLKMASSGRAIIGLKGKGSLLALPALPLSGTVTVELHRIGGTPVCWQATYASPKRNDTEQYSARGD
jgi:cysteine-rich repeat protein